MKELTLSIPLQLNDPFFFPESKVSVDDSHIIPDDPFFAYEILYYNYFIFSFIGSHKKTSTK